MFPRLEDQPGKIPALSHVGLKSFEMFKAIATDIRSRLDLEANFIARIFQIDCPRFSKIRPTFLKLASTLLMIAFAACHLCARKDVELIS